MKKKGAKDPSTIAVKAKLGPVLDLTDSDLRERFPSSPEGLDDELEEIDISRNSIFFLDVAIIEKYTPSLRCLNVSHNLIMSLETVIPLGTLQYLEELDIRHNPCCKQNRVILLVNLLFPWLSPAKNLQEAGARRGLEEDSTHDSKRYNSTLRASCSAPSLVSAKGQAEYQERLYRSCHSETAAPYVAASAQVRRRFAELQKQCTYQTEEKSPATPSAPSTMPISVGKGDQRFIATPFRDRKHWEGLSDSILGAQVQQKEISTSCRVKDKSYGNALGAAKTVGRRVQVCLPRAHLFAGPLDSPRSAEEISGLRFPRLLMLNGSLVSVQQLEDVAVQAFEMLQMCKEQETHKREESRSHGKDEHNAEENLQLHRLKDESYNQYCTRIHKGFAKSNKHRGSTSNLFYSKDFEKWTKRRNEAGGRPDSDEDDYQCKAVYEFEHPKDRETKEKHSKHKMKAMFHFGQGKTKALKLDDQNMMVQQEYQLWEALRQHLWRIKQHVGLRGHAESNVSSAADDWKDDLENKIEDLEFEMRATARERQKIKELRRPGVAADAGEKIFDKCQQTLLESWNMMRERSLPQDESAASIVALRHFQDPTFEDVVGDGPSLALKGDGPGKESKGRSSLDIEKGRTRLAKALCKSIHEDYSSEAWARRVEVLRSSRLWRLHEYADRLEEEEAMRPQNKRQQLIDGIREHDLEGLDDAAFEMLMEEIEVGREAKACAQEAKAADATERRAQTTRQDIKELVVDNARRHQANKSSHGKHAVAGTYILGVRITSEFASRGEGRAGRSTFHHGGRIDRNLMPRCAPPAARAAEYRGGSTIKDPALPEDMKKFFDLPKLPESLDHVPQEVLNEAAVFSAHVAGLSVGDRIRVEMSRLDECLKSCEDTDQRLAEQRRMASLLKSNSQPRPEDAVDSLLRENIAYFDVDNQNSDKRAMALIRRKFFDGMQAALSKRAEQSDKRTSMASEAASTPVPQTGIAVQSEHLKTWLAKLEKAENEEDEALRLKELEGVAD
eukprot:gnl/MRDRNA2_/MRDRNA2_120792_c0_seq1.p1 gnl/MRDRNA2_/MRDRNA2_120792_c0~~gnl/MRDRNA2_/MRDRNA2_120792_c0_seq1.p1  ORF type:complete len:1013 (+),score=249.43 gnl/MRDRNA2_/MRDRNA2_120792_c0_seq1:91-3129(+)